MGVAMARSCHQSIQEWQSTYESSFFHRHVQTPATVSSSQRYYMFTGAGTWLHTARFLADPQQRRSSCGSEREGAESGFRYLSP
jgi:hypothetical protein